MSGHLKLKLKLLKIHIKKEEMQEIALSNDNVKASIEGKDIMKVIASPPKISQYCAK